MIKIVKSNFSGLNSLDLVRDINGFGIYSNLSQKFIVPCLFSKIILLRERYFSCIKSDINTLYDLMGKVLISHQEGVRRIVDRDKDSDTFLLLYCTPLGLSYFFKILSLKTNQISRYKFAYVCKFKDKVAPFVNGCSTSFIRINGRNIAVPGYGKYGLLGEDNEIIIWATYSYIRHLRDGYIALAKGGHWSDDGRGIEKLRKYSLTHLSGAKWGLANIKGETILPCKYDFLGSCANNKIIYRSGEKYGYINLSNLEEKDAIFDSMKAFSEGLAPAAKLSYGGFLQWGFVNEQYDTIIDFEYNDAYVFKNGIAIVKKDDWVIKIDKDGKKISSHYDMGNNNFEYTEQDLEEMYRGAFEGEPDAQWNIW